MTCSSSLAMWRYSLEPRTTKFVKGYEFLSFARKYKKQLLDTGLDAVKISKNAEEFLGNKSQTTIKLWNENHLKK